MLVQGTSAERRKLLREKVKEVVDAAVDDLPNAQVFAARGEAEGLEDFINIYLGDGERGRTHSGADAESDLVIRINTKAEPLKADDRLDDIASKVEDALSADPTLDGLVWDSYHETWTYTDSPTGNYSALELGYQLKYDD